MRGRAAARAFPKSGMAEPGVVCLPGATRRRATALLDDEVALDAFSYEGSVHGLPYAMEAIGLFRNVDLVPDAPDTLDDLLEVCDELGNEVTQCLATPSSRPRKPPRLRRG